MLFEKQRSHMVGEGRLVVPWLCFLSSSSSSFLLLFLCLGGGKEREREFVCARTGLD